MMGGFVVDDMAVEQAGILQVVELLLDGVRALRAVDGKGKGIVVLEEIELVVDMWKLVGSHLRGHELAKTSFVHTSSNQRIVTRSPNHMWAVS